MKFKTNIKCDACVVKVTSTLNEVVGADKWKVDLSDPMRVLTTDPVVDPEKLNTALNKVGYKAEKI